VLVMGKKGRNNTTPRMFQHCGMMARGKATALRVRYPHRAQRHSDGSAEVAKPFRDFPCCRPTIIPFGIAHGLIVIIVD